MTFQIILFLNKVKVVKYRPTSRRFHKTLKTLYDKLNSVSEDS